MDYQNFATLGVNLNRQKYGPLDISSVFTSEADLKYYITKGQTKEDGLSDYWENVIPYPYEGQLVSLNLNGKVTIYKLLIDGDTFIAEDITATIQADIINLESRIGNDIVTLSGKISEIETKIDNLPDTPDLTGYATEGYVDGAVTSVEENMKQELLGEVELLNGSISALETDLKSYATKTYVNETFTTKTEAANMESNLGSMLEARYEDAKAEANTYTDNQISATLADIAITYVPQTRTINGYKLSSNITLDADDVKADPEGTAETKASEALNSAKSYTEEYALPKTTTINGQSCNAANNYVIEASNIPLTNQDDTNAEKLNVETYLNYLDSEIQNLEVGGNFLPSETTINGYTWDGTSSYLKPNYTVDATRIPAFDRGLAVSDYLGFSVDDIHLNDTDSDGLAIVYSKNNSDEEIELRPFDNYPLKKAASATAVRLDTAKAETFGDLDDESTSYWMGSGSMAIGEDTMAPSSATFAAGKSTEASGAYSASFGERTKAVGNASLAIGNSSTAKGLYSLAEGVGTVTTLAGSHAQGRWNVEDTAQIYAHIVGWGYENAPANIHTLETNGNAWFAGTGTFEGDVYAGGKRLATSEQVSTVYSTFESAINSHKTLIDSKADASALNDYVPTSRTINGKALSSNIVLSYSDVDADAAGTALSYYNTLNNKINNIDLSGYVPITRTINSKTLDSNITLSAADVGADTEGAAAIAESNAKSYADSTFLPKTITVNLKNIDGNNFHVNAYDIRTLPDDQPDSAIADNKLSVGLYLSTLDNEIDDLKAKTENSAYITQDQLFINGMAWGGVGSGGKEDSFTLTGQNIYATIEKTPTSESEEVFPINDTVTNLLGGAFRKVSLNNTSRRFVFESWNGSHQSVEIPGSSLSYLLNGEINEGAVKMITACEEGYTLNGDYDGSYSVGKASMALGDNCQAPGEASLAIGKDTQAGYYRTTDEVTTTSGIATFAAGIGTAALVDASTAFGTYNNPSTYLFTIGNGYIADGATSPTQQNAFTLDKSGNAWFAGRIQIGKNTSQEQAGSTGWDSDDTLGASTLITRFEMKEYIDANINKEFINLAHISDGTEAGSFYTSTSVKYSEELGIGSVTLGYLTKASGYYSLAVGKGTTASGQQAFSQGYYTEATGTNSAAFGYWTSANATDSLACGRANIIDSSNTYALTVGNGQSATNRSNGFTVDWSGNGWFAGEIRVGGTGQDDSASAAVATQKYVNTQVAEVTLTKFGITASSDEINYTDGVTSNIQTQLDGKAASSHTQSAGTITAGCFAGTVYVSGATQSPNSSILRNSKLVSTETTPGNNGEIFWLYE